MEYESYFSGIGGQGIQLIAKTLALAATAEDRHVMLNGFYGSEMRGGISMSTVVIGNAPLIALPVTANVGAAVVLHHHFWETPHSRLRDGSLLVIDAEIADHLPPMPEHRLVQIPSTKIAREIGNPMVSGMVLMSAFNAMTGLVQTQSLLEAMRELVPPYRRQHIEANEKAIIAGADAGHGYSYPVDLGAVSEDMAA